MNDIGENARSFMSVVVVGFIIVTSLLAIGVLIKHTNDAHTKRYHTCVEAGGSWVSHPELCVNPKARA